MKVYDEREAIEQKLKGIPTVTVTNYSEFSVFFRSVDIPNDVKVWVHAATSPSSVAAIRQRIVKESCHRRILFESDLTSEELAGDVDELYRIKNPQYSSDESEIIEAGADDSDYSDPELQAVKEECKAMPYKDLPKD